MNIQVPDKFQFFYNDHTVDIIYPICSDQQHGLHYRKKCLDFYSGLLRNDSKYIHKKNKKKNNYKFIYKYQK